MKCFKKRGQSPLTNKMSTRNLNEEIKKGKSFKLVTKLEYHYSTLIYEPSHNYIRSYRKGVKP